MLACSLQLRTKNTCVLTNAAARCDVLGDYRCGSERACVDDAAGAMCLAVADAALNARVLTNAAGAMCLCFQHTADTNHKSRRAFLHYSILALHKGTFTSRNVRVL